MSKINSLYGTKTLFSCLDTIILVVKEGYYSIERMYEDYISMVGRMGLTTIFKPRFNTIQELRTAHDNVTSLYNLKRDEYRTKVLKKLLKKLKNMNIQTKCIQ